MTTGQLIFYSGIVLLVLTIIVAIVFLIKKPKYVAENAANESVESGDTRLLWNSYLTGYETIRRDSIGAKTVILDEEEAGTVAVFSGEEKELLPPTEKIEP